MTMTATQLRAHLYKTLDQVIDTQKPVEIMRKGQKLQIILAEKGRSKLAQLQAHPGTIKGDPEELVHMDWSGYWKGDL
jgi:hypothetical protein